MLVHASRFGFSTDPKDSSLVSNWLGKIRGLFSETAPALLYCPPDVTAAVSSSILSSSASTSSCILSASSVTIGEDLRSLCLWLSRPPFVRGPPEMLRGNEDGLQAEEGEPGSDRGAGLEVGDDGRPEEVQGSWKGRLWGESSWSECGTEVEESGAIDQSDASTSARTLGGESGPLLV